MNKSTHIESSSKQAIKELVVISLVTTLVLLLSSLFRSFGRFGNWFEAPHQLDEVFVPASILIFAFGIYAHRRWCELKRVIELREKAEASLQQREEQYLSLLNKQE